MLPTLSGHPSAAVLPAVLALSEELDKSGEEALSAYIAGIEIIDIMARGLNQQGMIHYSKGWHSTESIGIFGATAASGILLGLTKEQLVNALSIACSESSGLQGQFGSMAKAFQAGRAGGKGIFIAKIAKEGYEANPNIFEVDGGFVKTTTGEINLEAMIERMSNRQSAFFDPGITMKPYPCCKCNHNIIDAVYKIIKEQNFTIDDVDRILIRAQPLTVGCLKYPEPKTKLEGKFSANYNAAIVLVTGKRPTIKDFEGDEIKDERIINAMKKIKMVVDHSIAGGAYFGENWYAPVEITLKDGRKFVEGVAYARGDAPHNPMTEEEVIEKIRECMAINLYLKKLDPIINMLKNLEKINSITELTTLIESAVRHKQR